MIPGIHRSKFQKQNYKILHKKLLKQTLHFPDITNRSGMDNWISQIPGTLNKILCHSFLKKI
ncbi:hypothetical protein Hanom_Chr02g00103331 [Helianthus anomalus]